MAFQNMTNEQVFLAISTLATVSVAIVALVAVILQTRQFKHDKKVAEANYKFSLYEKRLAVYYAVLRFAQEFFKNRTADNTLLPEFDSQTSAANFLFGDDIVELVKNTRSKFIEHELASVRWEPLREKAFSGQQLSKEEERQKNKYATQRHEIAKWFLDNTDHKALKKAFGSYLELPEDLNS